MFNFVHICLKKREFAIILNNLSILVLLKNIK